MCLLLIGWRQHARYPLVLAANRDEFHHRATEPLGFWRERPDVLAGRDLVGGGTWLGVTRQGRLAALTNIREGQPRDDDAPSRGELVRGFLESDRPAGAYLETLARRWQAYHGFNLVVGDREELWWASNRAEAPRRLAPGVYGVSNAQIDTPWPKVVRGRRALAALLTRDVLSPDDLLAPLLDRTVAPDDELPETGVGRDRERALSPIFISEPGYGTRSSTAILIDHDGTLQATERVHDPGRRGPRTAHFDLPPVREPAPAGTAGPPHRPDA